MTGGQGPGGEESETTGADEGIAPAQSSPDQRPMHPALEPSGEHVAHSAIGSLVGGVLVWGGVGLLLDRWLGTAPVLAALGVVVGSMTGFLIVYLRFGRDE